MKNFIKDKLFRKRRFWFFVLIICSLFMGGWLIYAQNNQVLPQTAIHFLNDVKAPDAGQRVLVFSPHPDDETIATGGYIYDSEKRGAEVRIILVTDGNKHKLKERRYTEFKKATMSLGVKEEDLVYLNHPDGKLKNENESALLAEFKANIEQYKPDIVFYPSLSDKHPDHATTGRIAREIIKNQGNKIISYQYLVHDTRFPQPKRFEPDLFLLPPLKVISFDQEWQRYMLSSESEEKKTEAVFNYESQLKTPILRGVIMSLIRKNELFSKEPNE